MKVKKLKAKVHLRDFPELAEEMDVKIVTYTKKEFNKLLGPVFEDNQNNDKN